MQENMGKTTSGFQSGEKAGVSDESYKHWVKI